MSFPIKIGNYNPTQFLPMRNKFVYSCSIKIHALGFDELLESIVEILKEAVSVGKRSGEYDG